MPGVPELPEVETIARGVRPVLVGQRIERVVVREPRLRWRVADDLPPRLAGRTVRDVRRRAKYLVVDAGPESLIAHLGMSGRLLVVEADAPPAKHDHADVVLGSGLAVRLRDPRRFGSLHVACTPGEHPLLAGLGPEPLDGGFDGEYLYAVSRRRTVAIKDLLLNSRIVAGIGNIYASEALFAARVHPRTPAGRLGRVRLERIAGAVRAILQRAIATGGTTLRDYRTPGGDPGLFAIELSAYGRAGLPCTRCGAAIRALRAGGRSTFYCPRCQRR